jgi:hypothetical protein
MYSFFYGDPVPMFVSIRYNVPIAYKLEYRHGTYSNTTGWIACLPCGMGKHSTALGVRVCLDCTSGKYSASEGRSTCTDCAVSTYCATAGASVCPICPACTYSGANASVCCICPAICVCGSPRGDLSHIAGLTLGRSTERLMMILLLLFLQKQSLDSGANLRPQDHTCVGGVGLIQQIA